MGKLGRGALWVGFWPAGLFASLRAGKRRDTQRIVEALKESGTPPVVERSPQKEARSSEVRRRKNDIDRRLKELGFGKKTERMHVHMQVYHLVVNEGMTIEQAIDKMVEYRAEVATL